MHRNLPQNKEALLKSYTTRLKEDVKSMLENFEGKYREQPYIQLFSTDNIRTVFTCNYYSRDHQACQG